MARPKPARVSKHSAARLGSRFNAGNLNTAITTVAEEIAMDRMDTTGDSSHFNVVDNVRAPGKGLMRSQEEVAVEPNRQRYPQQASPRQDKGKGRAGDGTGGRHFAFMELPTELRLEIYRACLTRPCNILLSKTIEPPPESAEEAYPDYTRPENDAVLNLHENQPDAFMVLSRPRASPAATYSRNLAGALNGRTAHAGGHPRTMSRLTRPVVPRRGQSSTFHFTSDQVALPVVSSSNASDNGYATVQSQYPARSLPGRQNLRPRKKLEPSTDSRPINDDPLIVNILRTNKAIYKEARAVLYNENVFDLSIDTAVSSLAALHQRSRRLIRHVELEIPSYTEIQDKFSEVVRLSLRYCSGLRKLVIHTPFCLPGGDGSMTPNSNIQIWAQGFDILRWLPQQCDVVLMGNKNAEIEEVVNKHLHLAKTLTPVAYAHRQLIPSDADRASPTLN